jgi:hypothetical protein
MALDYSSLLSDEQKKSILEQRLTQFAAEAYQHDINKTVAKASGNTEGVAAAEAALETLEAAINVHQDELAKLPSAE